MKKLIGFLHVYVRNILNIVFKFWAIVEKMKTDVHRQILVLTINNQISIDIVKFEFFLFSKLKVAYLRPLLLFILLLKF